MGTGAGGEEGEEALAFVVVAAFAPSFHSTSSSSSSSLVSSVPIKAFLQRSSSECGALASLIF